MVAKMEIVFNTAFKRTHSKGEINNGPRLVEPGESIPIKMMVDRMMLDGEILSAQRRWYYEFGPEEQVPAGYYDPCRDPNFDMADASRIQGELIEKHRQGLLLKEETEKVIAEAEKKVEAEQKAEYEKLKAKAELATE